MLYRIKQFIWAISANFQSLDEEYINRYLNEEEKNEFYKLLKSEQMHSLRVSKYLILNYKTFKNLDNCNLNNCEALNFDTLARLGLLHDLGKQNLKFGAFSKSIYVILKKISKGNLNKYSRFKKINLYYNHPITGVNIIKRINSRNYSKEFIEAIEKHHCRQDIIYKTKNLYLIALNKADDKN